jgi:hypothetical protein
MNQNDTTDVEIEIGFTAPVRHANGTMSIDLRPLIRRANDITTSIPGLHDLLNEAHRQVLLFDGPIEHSLYDRNHVVLRG